MIGVTLIGLFIIQSSNVMADQQSVAKISSSLKTEVKSNSNSNKSTSESAKNQASTNQTSNLQTSSQSESSQTSSVISNSSSKQSGLSGSSASNELSSVEKVKQKTDQMTSGKKSNSRLLKEIAIDDGVNWNPVAVPQTTMREIPLDDLGRKISFTFGNGDGSLAYYKKGVFGKPLQLTKGEMPPKLNFFIKNIDGSLTSALSHGISEGTSESYDFAFAPDESPYTELDTYSIPYLIDKGFQIFEGTTSTGKPALKAVGTSTVAGTKLGFEILLRPDDEKPVLREEIYIKSMDKEVDGGIFLAQAIGLDPGADMYTLGKGHGFYVPDNGYKVLMNFNVPDGPFAFVNAINNTMAGGDWGGATYALTYFTNGHGWAAGGVEYIQAPNQGLWSTYPSFGAKFPWAKFTPDHYEHYRSDVGLVSDGVVVPDAGVEYTNDSKPEDGKNHVRDDVTVTMFADNEGLKSSWDDLTLTAPIPKGLSIDDSSLKVVTDFGADSEAEVPVESSSYNAKTRMLTVKLPKNLKDGEWEAVRYKASFNSYASGQLNTQKMEVKGGDTIYNKATAEKDIPVEEFPNGLVKEVRNVTQKETEYNQQIEASPKETVEYKVDFWVDKKGADITGINLSDSLSKLDFVKGSAKLQYEGGATESLPDPAGASLDVPVKDMKQGEKVTITYQAKVKADAKEKDKIKNMVTFLGNTAALGSIADYTDATVNVVLPKIAKVNFKYIDRKTGAAIANPVTVEGPIGSKISSLKPEDMTLTETQSDGTSIPSSQDVNKIRPAYIEGYTPIDYIVGDDLTANPEKIADVDPEIEVGDSTYTFRYEKTRLELTSLPSKMNFGKFYDTQADRTFYLPATAIQPRDGNHYKKTPYSIEVTDYWGINGWNLSVQQDQQFHFTRQLADGKPETVNLDGAQLQFHNAKLTTETKDKDSASNEKDSVTTAESFNIDPGAAPQTLIDYQRKGQYLEKDGDNTKNLTYDSPGYSVHKYQFGDEKSADYSIGLHVPGTTKRYAQTYLTTLLWNLTVAP